jgi:DNA uptake protein ComE-like DNA-binding protein
MPHFRLTRRKERREQKRKAEQAADAQAADAQESAPDEAAIRDAAEREAMARLEQAESGEGQGGARAEEERIKAEADRRIREVEQRRDAEQRGGEAGAQPELPASDSAPAGGGAEGSVRAEAQRPEPEHERLLAELGQSEQELGEGRVGEQAPSTDVQEAERRLAESQRTSTEVLERAARRLEAAESRAAEAEERAARAERLAAVKAEEIERARRLREMLGRIADAERRATEAEQRARRAVDQASEPVPDVDPNAIFVTAKGEADETDNTAKGEAGEDASAAEPSTEEAEPVDAGPETLGESDEDGPLSINEATYAELRRLGLSVAQTGRLLAYRERIGGFKSVDDLERITGLPRGILDELKRRSRP